MSFNDHIIDHFLRGSLSQPFGRLLHLNIQMSWGRSQPTIWPLVTFEYSNVLGAAQPIKNEELRTILGQPFLGRPNPYRLCGVSNLSDDLRDNSLHQR
jgi:hypothetical protein